MAGTKKKENSTTIAGTTETTNRTPVPWNVPCRIATTQMGTTTQPHTGNMEPAITTTDPILQPHKAKEGNPKKNASRNPSRNGSKSPQKYSRNNSQNREVLRRAQEGEAVSSIAVEASSVADVMDEADMFMD